MSMEYKTSCVAISNRETVLQELKRPEIMGAIIPEAWSTLALAYASDLTARPEHNRPETQRMLLRESSDFPSGSGSETFQAELRAHERLFKAISLDLLETETIRTFTRLEPAVANGFAKAAGDWHHDGGKLILLSIPSGIATEYVSMPTKGPLKGKQSRWLKRPLDTLGGSIPNNALIVFKGKSFPFDEVSHVKGLVHRRPNDKLGLDVTRGRLVVHMTMSA